MARFNCSCAASDSRQQQLFRELPQASHAFAGRGCGARAGILRMQGDVDTWIGCIMDPVDAITAAERTGFADVAVLPDEFHAGMGYWLVGRVPG